jgi:hypothetical protein
MIDDDFDVNEILSDLTPDQKLAVVKTGFEAMRQQRQSVAAGQPVDVETVNSEARRIAAEKGIKVDQDDPEWNSIAWQAKRPEDFLETFEKAHDAKKTRAEIAKKTRRLNEIHSKGLQRTFNESKEARQILDWLNAHDTTSRGGKR